MQFSKFGFLPLFLIFTFTTEAQVFESRAEVDELYKKKFDEYAAQLKTKNIKDLQIEATKQEGLALATCGFGVGSVVLNAVGESVPLLSDRLKLSLKYYRPDLAYDVSYVLKEIQEENIKRSFGLGTSQGANEYSALGIFSGVADIIANIRARLPQLSRSELKSDQKAGHTGPRALSANYMRTLEAFEMRLAGKPANCRIAAKKAILAETESVERLMKKIARVAYGLAPDPRLVLKRSANEFVEEGGAASAKAREFEEVERNSVGGGTQHGSRPKQAGRNADEL